jgi:hypothetical protein
MNTLLATAFSVLLAAMPVRAEIIDRILAVVAGQLITLSDVRGVTRLGLETPPAGADPIRAVLDILIDRQLMLVEVERYAPPEPESDAIDRRLEAIRARFPDALAFETTLHQVGMTVDHLRRYIRDALRVESYLQQRFTAAIQPSDGEIAAYYRLHADKFTRDGGLMPYADARSAARSALIEERRLTLVQDWLTSLRRRADIVDLYLVTATGRVTD